MNAVAKEGKWFLDDNYRTFSKDTTNGLVALSLNSGKDSMPSTTADIEGTLANAVTTYFSIWENAQQLYANRTFQGNAESLAILSQAFDNGLMLADPQPDLFSLNTAIQRMMYSQLVIEAWKIAPGLSATIL
jgi:hypothetical protein